MKISLRQLKNMRVETELGLSLGRVKDVVMQTDGQHVEQYIVGKIFGEGFVISRDHIVRFEKDKMIVEDSVVTEHKKIEHKKSGHHPEAVVMRDADI